MALLCSSSAAARRPPPPRAMPTKAGASRQKVYLFEMMAGVSIQVPHSPLDSTDLTAHQPGDEVPASELARPAGLRGETPQAAYQLRPLALSGCLRAQASSRPHDGARDLRAGVYRGRHG